MQWLRSPLFWSLRLFILIFAMATKTIFLLRHAWSVPICSETHLKTFNNNLACYSPQRRSWMSLLHEQILTPTFLRVVRKSVGGIDAETFCILFRLSALIQSNLNPFRFVVRIWFWRLSHCTLYFNAIILQKSAQLKQCLNPLYKTPLMQQQININRAIISAWLFLLK